MKAVIPCAIPTTYNFTKNTYQVSPRYPCVIPLPPLPSDLLPLPPTSAFPFQTNQNFLILPNTLGRGPNFIPILKSIFYTHFEEVTSCLLKYQ